MKALDVQKHIEVWIHGGAKVPVTDGQEPITEREFHAEDIVHIDGAMYPFHAINALEVETIIGEREIDDCPTDEPVVPKPVIYGVEDISISEGTAFDPMDGVYAEDSDGNPVPVTVSGVVDVNIPSVYPLTYTATDGHGQTTTARRIVTVVALGRPVINGANDVTIDQGDDIDLRQGVTATLDGTPIEFTVFPEAFDECEVGLHEVTYTATGNGYTTTVVRKVTVERIDNPLISGISEPILVMVNVTFDALDGVTAVDGKGNPIAVTSNAPTSYPEPSVNQITYTATDDCDNTTTDTRTVIVKQEAYWDGLSDVTIDQGDVFDPMDGVVAWNEDGDSVAFSVSPASIDTCVAETHTLTYSAVGLPTETRDVSVTSIGNPVISGISEPITIGVDETFDALDGVTAVDGKGNTIAVTTDAPSSYSEPGDYTISYTATDSCGNTTTNTRAVEVTLEPHWEGLTTITSNQGLPVDLITGVKAIDADGNEVPFTVTPSTVDVCAVTSGGEYEYSTAGGVVPTAHRTVIVQAIPDPTINGISTTIEVDVDEVFDALDGVTAVDGNGQTITVTSDAPQSYSQVGEYVINYTATDSCGNTTTSTRPVIVHGLMTTLYSDGTLMFNESTRNRATSTHGDVVAEYAPLSDDNPYVFANGGDQPWVSKRSQIRAVEFATPVAPTNMSYWFQECQNMDSIGFTNLDTSNNTGLRATFSKTAFTTMSGLPAMPNLETLRYAFALCPNLTNVNLRSLNSTKVTDCNATFQGCYELLEVTLKFGNSTIQTCANMFSNESSGPNMKLKKIVNTGVSTSTGFEDRPNFSQATSSANMFRGCVDLVGGTSTPYDSTKVDKTWARCAFGVQQGYFTVG